MCGTTIFVSQLPCVHKPQMNGLDNNQCTYMPMYLSAKSWVAVANPALDMDPAATERVKMAWAIYLVFVCVGVWVVLVGRLVGVGVSFVCVWGGGLSPAPFPSIAFSLYTYIQINTHLCLARRVAAHGQGGHAARRHEEGCALEELADVRLGEHARVDERVGAPSVIWFW